MMNHQRIASGRAGRLAVASAALLLGSILVIRAVSQCPWCIEGENDPSLNCPGTVAAGATLDGVAWTLNPPVKVEATWKITGEDLEGSPDWGTLGEEVNPFSFPVPGDTPDGAQILVSATNSCGITTSMIVTVQRP